MARTKKKVTPKQFLDANKEAVEELSTFERLLLFGRLGLSVIVFVLCILGITKVISTNIAVPIALSIMALMMFLYGFNNIRLKKIGSSIFYLFMAVFLTAFVVVFEMSLK